MFVKILMIRWKLKEVMARYDITGIALAEELGVRPESISNWRTSKTMPRINGEKVQQLTNALSKLSNTKIIFADLYEETGQLPHLLRSKVGLENPGFNAKVD